MKKLIIALSIILSISLYTNANAQSININVNLDKQPAWGPTGYNYAGYYYIPDLNIYYDINNALYYYLSGSKWVSAQYLPNNYRKSDFYSLYKVVINDSQPWLQNKTHKKEYASYKGDKTQTPIRNSNEAKYNTSKGNTNSWINTNQNKNTNSSKNNTQNRTEGTNKTNGNTKNQNNKTNDRNTSNNNGNRK